MSRTIAARAAWIVAPRQVELREELVPPPGPGQVRIAALASAISHGTETLVYAGQVDPALPLDLPTLAGSLLDGHRVATSQRRVSAGSMTASISSVAAMFIAWPAAYCFASSCSKRASRCAPSGTASSSLR